MEEIGKSVCKAGMRFPIETLILKSSSFENAKIQDALKKQFGIKDFCLDGDRLTVNIYPVGIDAAEITSKLAAGGMTAEVVSRDGGDEDIQLHERMLLLKKLCISAFLTMPLVWDLNPWLQLVIASIVQFWPGLYFYKNAWNSIRNGSMSMDCLVALSTSVIYAFSVYSVITQTNEIKLYFLSQCVLLTLILFGKYLETLSRNQTSDAIRKLMRLQPKTALVERDGEEKEMCISDIDVHDFIRVRPGERIPVDGLIIDGSAAIDESMLSGESIPVEKKEGDTVYCGTLSRSGSIKISASGIGKDTVLMQIVDIVERAQISKAPIQRYADKIANLFIPCVIAASAAVFCARYFLISPKDLNTAVYCMCSVLVIACPCALGLSTPTGIMEGSGRAAELGILFRDGTVLENAEKCDAVVFDKTGTLTYGEMDITDYVNLTGDASMNLLMASAVERLSEHPIAKAVVRGAALGAENALPPAVTEFETFPGYGVKGNVQGNIVLLGSRQLLVDHGTDISLLDSVPDLRKEAKTEVLLSVNGQLNALFGIADRIRPDACQTVESLKKMGLDVYMMTGDNKVTAEAIGHQSGIDFILADVRPEEKAEHIAALRSQGKKVCMVGDGINDAPALAAADIAIALTTGTDVAIDSSGIIIPGNSLKSIPAALRISSKTMKVIRQNLIWALCYNIICIPVAASGIINPSIAAAAMSLSSNGVLLNSLKLRKMEDSR